MAFSSAVFETIQSQSTWMFGPECFYEKFEFLLVVKVSRAALRCGPD